MRDKHPKNCENSYNNGMDELDSLIIEQLIEDSRRSVTEIAQAISLSHSATRIRLGKIS